MSNILAKAFIPGYRFNPPGADGQGNSLVCDYLVIRSDEAPDSQFPKRFTVTISVDYADRARDIRARLAYAINASTASGSDITGHIDVEFVG